MASRKIYSGTSLRKFFHQYQVYHTVFLVQFEIKLHISQVFDYCLIIDEARAISAF